MFLFFEFCSIKSEHFNFWRTKNKIYTQKKWHDFVLCNISSMQIFFLLSIEQSTQSIGKSYIYSIVQMVHINIVVISSYFVIHGLYVFLNFLFRSSERVYTIFLFYFSLFFRTEERCIIKWCASTNETHNHLAACRTFTAVEHSEYSVPLIKSLLLSDCLTG